MADRVGRKWGIIASCGVFSLGVGLQLDTHWAAFVVGRGTLKRNSLMLIIYLRVIGISHCRLWSGML
jgi:hypothetical protein